MTRFRNSRNDGRSARASGWPLLCSCSLDSGNQTWCGWRGPISSVRHSRWCRPRPARKLTIALHPDLQEILGALATHARRDPHHRFRKTFLHRRIRQHDGRCHPGRRTSLPGVCHTASVRPLRGGSPRPVVPRSRLLLLPDTGRSRKSRGTRQLLNQERLAAQAVDKLTEQKTPRNSQPQPAGLGSRRNS